MTAQEFKRLRLDKGLTQVQASELIGVTARTVARWESGLYEIPPLKEAGIREMLAQYQGESR